MSYKRRGGIRFLKIGRLSIQWSVAKTRHNGDVSNLIMVGVYAMLIMQAVTSNPYGY